MISTPGLLHPGLKDCIVGRHEHMFHSLGKDPNAWILIRGCIIPYEHSGNVSQVQEEGCISSCFRPGHIDCKINGRQLQHPVSLCQTDTRVQHLSDSLIRLFGDPIRLWMVCTQHALICTDQFVKVCPEALMNNMSRSLTIDLGRPCSLYTSAKTNSAISLALYNGFNNLYGF